MAEIQTTSSAKQKGVKRISKKSTRVDLTPMVDLGFLLITFFVFTTALSEPKVMDIVNHKDSTDPTPVCESCVLTLILEKDNRILYYEGMEQNVGSLKETSFTTDGLRKLLLNKRSMVNSARGKADDMVLIIKPSEHAVYRNFVDVLDEVAITKVKHYFIDEIDPVEKKMLGKQL